jgi:hypothetical protein
MNKPPVIVCGGSYMTPAHESHFYAGTHFAEIVAHIPDHEYNLINE